MKNQLRVIVSGLAALQPVGGMAWHYLQYVVGLARLGHDVYYFETTSNWPYDPGRQQKVADSKYVVPSPFGGRGPKWSQKPRPSPPGEKRVP